MDFGLTEDMTALMKDRIRAVLDTLVPLKQA